jgi:UPF0755 protein
MSLKSKIIAGLVLVILITGGMVGFKGVTGFKNNTKTIIIRDKDVNRNAIEKLFKKDSIVTSSGIFNAVASATNFWDNIKPGRYEIKKGSNAYSIIKTLKTGLQKPVKFTINKIRTENDLAKLVGIKFSTDSATFHSKFLNYDTLKKMGVDSAHFLASIIPNTFEIYFDANGKNILKKLFDEGKKFWTADRKQKAEKQGFTPHEITTIASIVEEETTLEEDKGNVASVYINRLRRNMKLQADPTVIYASKKFGAKQVTFDMLKYPSKYNTYYSAGLPPGPICTPSVKTIDAVLNAPETPFIFFVANSDFSGKHIFTTNEKDHLTYATLWRTALAEQQRIKKEKEAFKKATEIK